MASFAVPEPSRFAATVLVEALKEQGISAALAAPTDHLDFKALAKNYTAENMVAEHISPPLKEEVKITLKVSQNVHASSMPYLLERWSLTKTRTLIRRASMSSMNFFVRRVWTSAAQRKVTVPVAMPIFRRTSWFIT